MLFMGGSTGYRISSPETWLWEPTALPSPWGHEHDSLGEWTKESNFPKTNAGMAVTSYTLGEENAGVLMFGGIETPQDDVKTMVYSNSTSFWSCSETDEKMFLQ